MGWADLPDRVPEPEARGAYLAEPAWQLDGDIRLAAFFEALLGLLPADAVVYLEGGHPEGELEAFLAAHEVPERLHLAFGTIWPRPRIRHLPASDELLSGLAALLAKHAHIGFANHVHVYDGDGVLLWWHDAGVDPMQLSARFGDDNVASLASRLGVAAAVQQAHRADAAS